jgi:DNA polymerase-3 subunit gamma/tau
VQFDELLERLEYIAKQEGVDADQEVLAVIANAGEGSVRDSLSALDQAIACCGKTLRVDEVRALLGVFAIDSLQSIADAVREQNGEKMLEVVQELDRTGQSLQHFCRELARYWRNLLVAKIAGKPTRLIAASDREQQAMVGAAGGFSEEDLTRYLQLTLDLYKTLQFSLQPRLHLELGLIKLVQVGKLQSIEEAISRLGADTPSLHASVPAPRTGIAKLAPFAARTSSPAPESRTPAIPEARAAIAPERELDHTNGAPVRQNTGDFKTDLHAALTEQGMKMSADAVQHANVRTDGAEVVFTTAKSFMLGLRDAAVARSASVLLGRPVKVRVEIDANMMAHSGPAPGSERKETQTPTDDNVTQRALSHPGVKRFQELFPGAHVRAVRNLNE